VHFCEDGLQLRASTGCRCIWRADATVVSWPDGVAGKGNEGVAPYVQRIKGAIGYVEYACAKKNNMSYANTAAGRAIRGSTAF
jgi:ABC-type phosphate transport system substrate-binding protein